MDDPLGSPKNGTLLPSNVKTSLFPDSPDKCQIRFRKTRHASQSPTKTVRRPLQKPYNCPYKVKENGEKFCKIQSGNNVEGVTVDRLKTAYLD